MSQAGLNFFLKKNGRSPGIEQPLTSTSHEVTSGIKNNTTNAPSMPHKAERLMVISASQGENLKK